MKLLYCELCGDIIAPHRQARKVRYCTCQAHAVWWEDPSAGILRVYATHGKDGWPLRAEAYVIGLHNGLLQWEGSLDAAAVEEILASTPETYLFKQWNSPVIRIRPGQSGDTRWANLPEVTNDA